MLENLPGFRDFPPERCSRRNHLFRVWRSAARHFGFDEWDGPVLESLELYIEKSGPEIVEQLFSFTDKGGREVALRPELTPTLARMVGSRANALPKPVKWFAIGENYRYERPQKGRLRAHYQWNCDLFGEAGPAADAEVMAVALHGLRMLGLGPADIRLRLSDRNLWSLWLQARGLGPEGVQKVLQAIDKFEREPIEKTSAKLEPILGTETATFLEAVGWLVQARDLNAVEAAMALPDSLPESSEALRQRFQEWNQLLTLLEAHGVAEFVQIDLGIVRGLAYYTGFVFEVFECSGQGRSICGGGRYDHLVRKLGGPDLPAVGFGMGDVTLGDLLESKGLLQIAPDRPEVYVVTAGEEAWSASIRLAAQLRESGLRVEYPLKPGNIGKQFKTAAQRGAPVAAVVGKEELDSGCIKIKDLRSGREIRTPLPLDPAWLNQVIGEGLESGGDPDGPPAL